MNIFVLDAHPSLAARMQCDKHVVKMILESAQIMSTIRGGPYKPTHENHPCVVWARSSSANYMWLWQHAVELCREYTRRYGKIHKSQPVVLSAYLPESVPAGELTPFVQCMPEQYRQSDAVQAYRAFYIGEKAKFAVWNYSTKPTWWPNA